MSAFVRDPCSARGAGDREITETLGKELGARPARLLLLPPSHGSKDKPTQQGSSSCLLLSGAPDTIHPQLQTRIVANLTQKPCRSYARVPAVQGFSWPWAETIGYRVTPTSGNDWQLTPWTQNAEKMLY